MRPASVKAVAQKAQRSPIAVFTYKYVVFRVSLPVSLSASATPSHRRPNKSAPPSLSFRRTLSVVLARTSLPFLPSHLLPPRRPSSPSVGRARWRPTPAARTEAPTAVRGATMGHTGPQRVAQGHGVVLGHSGARDGGTGRVGDGGARGGGAGRVEPRRRAGGGGAVRAGWLPPSPSSPVSKRIHGPDPTTAGRLHLRRRRIWRRGQDRGNGTAVSSTSLSFSISPSSSPSLPLSFLSLSIQGGGSGR